jgi:L,D-transpeptidase ErfK/SrfK
MTKKYFAAAALLIVVLMAFAAISRAHTWTETEFANRPLYAYPIPSGRDDLIGSLTTYKLEPGDTLLDVGRWFGLSAKEISDANGHMDWWLPPAGRTIVLPTEHILPESSHSGIILNVPEMRLYYYFPSPVYGHHKRGRASLTPAAYHGARVVYTFPVGLGRFDWKTPLGVWTITAKVKDPTWVLPEDIYEEHLERDGEADHVVEGGDPDNPLGHYKLDLSIPEYGLHGTNVPWGVGMTVSHGCVRLYPEDIERLFFKTPVGTPGEFVYEPVKFGWRGDALYVEVHDDLYGKYPGLWNHASQEVTRRGLSGDVDLDKLEKAVEAKSGIPTYVGTGVEPASGAIPVTAAIAPPAPLASAAPAAPAASSAPAAPAAPVGGGLPTAVTADSVPSATDRDTAAPSAPNSSGDSDNGSGGEWNANTDSSGSSSNDNE